MTRAQAREALRPLGWTLRKEGSEYRVAPVGGSEDAAYYTNDLEDAVGTARLETERARYRRYMEAARDALVLGHMIAETGNSVHNGAAGSPRSGPYAEGICLACGRTFLAYARADCAVSGAALTERCK